MLLTKQNIVSRINQQIVTHKIHWEDVVTDLDMAIDEINSYMSTLYPRVSEILDDFAQPEKTYSYRAGGTDIPYFSEKFFHSIVIPFVLVQILTRDEEFSPVLRKFEAMYQENLFVMVRDELNSVPAHLIAAPRGVYFPNPDPQFKENPEKYFNQRTEMPLPKLKVAYSWGAIEKGFVARPLPKDDNSYYPGTTYAPIIMSTNEYDTYVVDEDQTVIGFFVGWSFEKEGARKTIDEPFVLNQDVTLYAVFSYEIIRFKYNGNGGTLANWRPLYVNKREVYEDVIPRAGTALKKGSYFVGFDPIRINKEDLRLADDITFDVFVNDGTFSAEELAAIQGEFESPEIEFVAQWRKIIYKVSYHNAEVPQNGNHFTFVYSENPEEGGGFDLPLPKDTENFLGWWDNPEFKNNPVEKIYASDIGDKNFYAKYNEEVFSIRWLNQDGTIRKQESKKIGSSLEPPTPQEIPISEFDNRLSEYVFTNWTYLLGNTVHIFKEDYKVTRNETFTANYKAIPLQSQINIFFKTTENNGEYVETPISFFHDPGNITTQEIYNIFLQHEDQAPHEYSYGGSDYYAKAAFLINAQEVTTSFSVQLGIDYDLYILYGISQNTVTIKYPTFDENGNINGWETEGIEILVPEGATADTVFNTLVFSYDKEDKTKTLYQFEGFDGQSNRYFFFNNLTTDAEGLTPFTGEITLSLSVYPKYGYTTNSTFERKLIIFYDFFSISQNVLLTKERIEKKYFLNETINIQDLIDSFYETNGTLKDQVGYYKIASLHRQEDLEDTLPLTITMYKNKDLYAKIEKETKVSIYVESVLAREVFEKERADAKLFYVDDILKLAISNGYIKTLQDNQVTIGYHSSQDSTEGMTSFNISSSTPDGPYDLYHIKAQKQGFKITTEFVYKRGAEEFPTIFAKETDDRNFVWQNEKSIVTLYESEKGLMNILTSGGLNYNPDGENNKQLRGLTIREFQDPPRSPNFWAREWPIYARLGAASSVTQTLDFKISMERNTDWHLITVLENPPQDEHGDPMENILDAFVPGTQLRDLKIFVNKIKSLWLPYKWSDVIQMLPSFSEPGNFEFRSTSGLKISDTLNINGDMTVRVIRVAGWA